ncbi:MAG: universal stress protein [Actinobacteria bacterium]|nr:MAG: universal stress protein [Actinomycetota bacterium]
MVVGVDGSDASARALAWAVQEAELRHAPLHAVWAWDYMAGGSAWPGAAVEVTWDEEQQAEAVRTGLTSVIAEGTRGHERLQVQMTDVMGNPAAALMDAAEADEADMIVVGSRGRGGFKRLLLGSVSEQCATHAHCPVVVVR